MGMQTRQCTTNAWIHRSPFLSPENSQVTRGKFIDRSLHPTSKEKEGARLLDMVPVKKAFKLFSKTEKGFDRCCMVAAPYIPHWQNWAGNTMSGFGTPTSHGVLKLSLEASSAGLLAVGTLANQGKTLSCFSSFTNSEIRLCASLVEPSALIIPLRAASLSR